MLFANWRTVMCYVNRCLNSRNLVEDRQLKQLKQWSPWTFSWPSSYVVRTLLIWRCVWSCRSVWEFVLYTDSSSRPDSFLTKVCGLWLLSFNGMTNYPIGPHRTQSGHIGPHRDPIGPHRTPSDQSALNIVLPPANHRTVIHSLTRVHLANTFDNRYTRKVTNLNTIETNPL